MKLLNKTILSISLAFFPCFHVDAEPQYLGTNFNYVHGLLLEPANWDFLESIDDTTNRVEYFFRHLSSGIKIRFEPRSNRLEMNRVNEVPKYLPINRQRKMKMMGIVEIHRAYVLGKYLESMA